MHVATLRSLHRWIKGVSITRTKKSKLECVRLHRHYKMFMEGSRDITQSMPVGTMHRECEDTEQFHKTLLTGGTQKRKIKWEVIFSSTMMDGIGK